MSLKRFQRRISRISQRKPSLSSPGEVISESSPATTPPPTWPIILPILPDEGLHALVYHHTVNSSAGDGLRYCWTYVSQGLAKVSQKEIVFTICRRASSEQEVDFPPDPLRWYESVLSTAKSGQAHVREFQRCDVQGPGFCGRSDVNWIMYVSSRPISNVPAAFLPREWVQAIPLLAPEAEVAERFGVMRALNHLGSSQRCFPWPPWFDRDRTPCVTLSQMQGSIRGQVSYAVIPGISAVKKYSEFVLYIPEEAEGGIQEVIGVFQPNNALPLDCVHHKDADSGLLWRNTDLEPRGYASGGLNRCMNLNFFTFCPDQAQNELQVVEDGCVFMLRTETYIYIRERIKDLRPVSVSLPSDEIFRVEYGRRNSSSPALPEPQPIQQQQQQHQPKSPSPSPPPPSPSPPAKPRTPPQPSKPWHVHCDHVNLLDNNVTNPADSEPIARYIKAIENVLDALIPRTAPPGVEGGGRLAVEADVGGPDRWDKLSRRWITLHFTPPALEALPLGAIQDRLVELEMPDIEPRTRFQVMFNIWGYKRQ